MSESTVELLSAFSGSLREAQIAVELAPIVGAGLDRYPISDEDSDDAELARRTVA